MRMREKNRKFDVFDDLLKIIIVKGLKGIGFLVGGSLLLIFLSVAVYAAGVWHPISLADYVYNYDHMTLKFFLFLTSGFSIVLIIGVLLASITLLLSLKAWKGLTVLCLSVGLFIFLFLVPVPQTKNMYAVEVSIKQEYLEKYKELSAVPPCRTEFYLTYEEAKKEVEEDYPYPIEILVLKKITEKQEVKAPIIHIQLPKKPETMLSENFNNS